MVKISKNAKKILALTLAGVMTVGTVVPGSALSTVENVQAATTDAVAAEMLGILKSAYGTLNITTETLVKGDKIKGVSNINELLKNETQKSLEDEKFTGYTFTITKSNAQVLTVNDAYYTIQVTTPLGEKTDAKDGKVSYPVEIIDSAKVANTLMDLDLSGVTTPTEANISASASDEIIRIANKELNNGVYKDYASRFHINVGKDTDLDNQDGFVPVKITITNTNYSNDATAISNKYSIAVKPNETVDSKYMKIVKDAVKEVVIPYTATSAEAKKAANEAVEKAAKDALVAEGYNNISVAVTEATLDSGKWSGKISFNGDKAEELNNLSVKVASITGLTLIPVEGKTISNTIDLNNITDIYSAMNIAGVRVDFDLMDSKTITDLGKNNIYFSADSNYEAGKGRIGSEYTVTIKSRDPKTSYDVNISEKVVAVKTQDITKNINVKNISKVESADTSYADVSYDSEKKTVTVTAKKAGKVDLFVTDNEGRVTKILCTINASTGNISIENKGYVNTEVRLQNTADKFGFEATKVSVTDSDPDSYKDEGKNVVNATLETVGDESVIKISAVCDGIATIKVNGGLNGNLENTFKVNVKDGVVTVNDFTANKYTLELNADTIKAIQANTYSDDMKLTVDDLGFDSNCKIALKESGTVKDSILASDATNVTYKDNVITIYYGSASKTVKVNEEANVVVVDNLVQKLGLMPVSIDSGVQSPVNNNMVNAELTKDVAGNPIIKFTAGKDADTIKTGNAKFTVKDVNGNKASITVNVINGDVDKSPLYDSFTLDSKEEWKLEPSDIKTYTIGEKINLSDVKLVNKDGSKKYILTEEVISGFDTRTSKITDNKLEVLEAKVNYGGLANVKYSYKVKPQTATISTSSLGLASGETVKSVTNKGDSSITSVLNGNQIEIEARAVDKTGAAVVTTSTGNTISVQIRVSEDGKISTDIAKTFKSTTATVENTVENLGIKGTKATSSDENIVLAKVQGNKITLTSVAAGTATVTVTAGDKKATINVTIDEFGTITPSVNKYLENTPGWHAAENGGWYYVDQDGKIVENGWVDDNGVRYYIENGVTVYNTWKFFESEGVWRYFNKWGANVENGWYWVGKFCYFFRDGQMVENEWIKTNGIWSYVDKYGHALQNGWFKIDGKYYCFDKYGNMYADTYVGKYYVNKWGAWDSRYDKK